MTKDDRDHGEAEHEVEHALVEHALVEHALVEYPPQPASSTGPTHGTTGKTTDRTLRPSTRSSLIQRPRLLHDLVVQPAAVSLVCAPAGSGKTSLLRTLLDLRDDIPTGYIDAARLDRTPQGLWSQVLQTLRALDVFPATSRIHHLRAPEGTIAPGFVDDVAAAISTAERRVRLILDDLHLIGDQRILQSLDALLARQPDDLLLVLSTRRDPALALHRLRLGGRLHEIRGSDLAFRQHELVELLDRAGCHLDAVWAERLNRCTEGWAAGIRIAVLSLMDGADPAQLLTTFDGDDRGVADYLVAEVLAQQPEELRTFLLTTSVCTTLPVGLAVHLSGREDAAVVLDGLCQRQALTEQVGRRREVYRYHTVLRTYLDAERRRHAPSGEAALQAKAGEWFADQGDWLHALQHLALADAPDRFVDLLRRQAITVMFDGRLTVLREILEQLPPRFPVETSVILIRALLAFAEDGPGSAEEVLSGLDLCSVTQDTDHWLATLAAVVQLQRTFGGAGRRAALDELARLATRPTGSVDLDLLVLHHRGLAMLLDGDVETAEHTLREAAGRARLGSRDALRVSCLCHLAIAALGAEELRNAETLAMDATSIAAHRSWTRTDRVLPAHLALTWVHYQRGATDRAAHHLDAALASLGPTTDQQLVQSLAVCELLVRWDDGGDPYHLLHDHRRRTRHARVAMSPHFHASIGPALVRAALETGEPSWALEFAREHGDREAAPGEHDLMRAMLLRAAGHETAADKAVRPILDGSVSVLFRSTLIHAHLMAARSALQRASAARAHESLLSALQIAEETEILRPFKHAGPEVHEQLIVAADRGGHLTSVAYRVFDLVANETERSAPSALLTNSEAAILRDLPSLLTIRDIAAARCISINTVKTHLRATYRKLGVNGRREAVEVARKRGLL
jgi:LuxR family transcriptional regulator, maltose regulon positive regulatory protein